ncbi:S9 family peptidase [Stigmatella aurantiaca]|uniref:Prolyl oligopeptidase family protein, putative n=1 Tax=Stigmatella aurantiaca (strain DW4/3-1) TaxID=378806 RepID=Q08VI7_STIAD|nr:S9 family peptidase [Stigmatella aurantiaca]EAU64517.1 prolyl oligopeptidase family protein, putative [Stigmatella aurantiaca DW4/3-1]
MRTFPYVVVSAGLLAACASPRPSSPEAPVAVSPAPLAAEGTPPAESSPAPVAPDTATGAEAARIEAFSRQVTPYVDAFVNSEALFTRDGKQVLFVSSRDGLPQVYRADAASPTSPATRLLASKERVTLVDTTPDGQSLLILSDKGADENWSIWKVGLDGSAPVELTPGETMNRDTAFLPDLAPDTIYFSGRRMNEAASTVYAIPATGGPSRVIYRDDKPGFLTHVSRDGQQGLFVRYPSASENYLLHIDLASGKTRPLFPASGKVSIFGAQFSPDGRTVYVSTDGGGEQSWLLALESATGKELARYVEKSPATAIIQSINVANTGDVLALSLVAGNRSEVRLLDARTLKPRARVEMPLGQGGIQAFSEDGRRLAAIWSTPSSVTDVWVIDVKTGKVSPLRKEPRPALKELPAIETSIAEIRAHDGLALPTNVYLPKKRAGKLPVIVSYHGGPAGNSKIKWSATTAFFVSQGYAWVEPNVRGSGGFGRAFEAADNGAGRLEAFKDIETVGRWAASQPWADPDRVIIYGGSYGGYTVLIGLTRMPDLWRAGVDVFGVANMKTFMATTSGFIREIFLLEFGDPDKDAAFLESISPLKDVGQIVDPLLVYAGANDPRVPRGESDQIVRALRERKVPVEYMVAENEGHSLSRRENQIEFMARMARFLEAHAAPRQASAP